MGARPDVTVSIVNHESRQAVLAVLAALADDRTRRGRLQVIVVDNASTDGSAEAIRGRFPWVEIIADGHRRGFGANHNLALRRARGDYVLLLNDDTVVLPGAIDSLIDYLRAKPAVAVAAPQVISPHGPPPPSAWPLPAPALDVLGAVTLGRVLRAQSRGSRPRRVGWAMACALFARRSALLAVGGFDERFFMYSEEIDLCARLATAGMEIHWVPQAWVLHEGQASTGGHASPTRAVEMARSRRRYWEKHYGRAGRALARLSVGGQFAVLAAVSRMRGRSAEAFQLQARETFGGTARPGLREQAEDWNRRRTLRGTQADLPDRDPAAPALEAPARRRPPT